VEWGYCVVKADLDRRLLRGSVASPRGRNQRIEHYSDWCSTARTKISGGRQRINLPEKKDGPSSQAFSYASQVLLRRGHTSLPFVPLDFTLQGMIWKPPSMPDPKLSESIEFSLWKARRNSPDLDSVGAQFVIPEVFSYNPTRDAKLVIKRELTKSNLSHPSLFEDRNHTDCSVS
jgi:hypothetical protein